MQTKTDIENISQSEWETANELSVFKSSNPPNSQNEIVINYEQMSIYALHRQSQVILIEFN